MVARQAGYGQVFLLADGHAAMAGIATIPDWRSLAFNAHRSTPLIVAPTTILAESDWLESVASTRIEPTSWASLPDRIMILAPAAASDALALLDAEGGAYDFTEVQNRLRHHFAPPRAILEGIDPLVVKTPTDVRAAEKRLLRSLVKDTDGFMARHVERPISLEISRHLAHTAVTPNQMTLISLAIGLIGAPFFLSPRPLWQTVGALLFLAHSILDGCDGELARLRFQQSRWGGVLDFWGDNVVHAVVFACMAVGWSLAAAATWPLLLGAAAVLGSLGSASFVYWRLMRAKDDGGPLFTSVSEVPDQRLTRLLDAASRRDFIYLVLILALFRKSDWFLLLAALGAPIYFILVLVVAWREQRQKTATISGAQGASH